METHPTSEGRPFWQEQVEQWQASHLSKAAYCRRESLNVTTFHYWSRKLVQPDVSAGLLERPSAFVPLALSKGSTPAFSLTLADVTVSCDHPVSSQQLRQWLSVIRSSL